MNKEQEIINLQNMIVECRKAINNASSFGDTATVESIQRQINTYENRLAELNSQEESPKSVKEQAIEWLQNHIIEMTQLVDEVNSYDGSLADYTFIPMDEFNSYTSNIEPIDIVLKTYYGGFTPNADWFAFDACENLVSFYEYERRGYLRDNADEIFERIMENKDHISFPLELAEILVKGGLLNEE